MTTYKRHDATSIDALPPAARPTFRQEPARAPTVESDVFVPVLRSIVTGIGVAGCTACVALAAGVSTPFAFAGGAGSLTATLWWLRDVGDIKSLMWRIEENIGRDIDGDAQVGQPAPVDRLVPVSHGPAVSAVDIPEPPPMEEGDRQLRLPPSNRTIQKRILWTYMLEAFMSGDWTRDGRPDYIKQKEWADVRAFVRAYFPRVWETTDRPTLDWFVRKLGCTVTNGTEPNELNGE